MTRHNLLDDFEAEIARWVGWHTGEIMLDSGTQIPVLALHDPQENQAPRQIMLGGLWLMLQDRLLKARYIGGQNYDDHLLKHLKAIEHAQIAAATFKRDKRHLLLGFDTGARLHLLCSELRPESYRVTLTTEGSAASAFYSIYAQGILRGRWKTQETV